ncbi:hypothetical protein GR254_11585 [Mycobacterium tuberculosis]|nr:hypothetical protein [Mycobacterium tuberculosis]
MTDQSYAVDIAHPPAALLRLVNPILRSLPHSLYGTGPLRGFARVAMSCTSAARIIR